MQTARPFLSRLARDATGNTLALAAAAIVPFTILVGSGVDFGVAYMARGKLQNACDAGVLAARQAMDGTNFNEDIEAEADRFFEFNFPDGTVGATDLEFDVAHDNVDKTQLLGTASANIPTSLMRIAGINELPISVQCDAKRDMGHNDIMLVLDVTGSMLCAPGNKNCATEQSGSKISRLRSGALGLYEALESDDGSVTRFGIMPYSHTVNVGGTLMNKDIMKDQKYVQSAVCNYGSCWNLVLKKVNINDSSWNNGSDGDIDGETGNTQGFRTSGNACIEERPSIGNGLDPFKINDSITRDDIDERAGNGGNEPELQFGRYDPEAHTNNGSFVNDGVTFWKIAGQNVQVGCPSEATRLTEYDEKEEFEKAINLATTRVTGGTYHDIGMLWGARYISRTGFFAGNNFNQGDNVTEIDDIPVNQHIVFMTDGMLDTGETLYSAHGIERMQRRTDGDLDDLSATHIARFKSVCSLAKEMGITVWVIALDVNADTTDIKQCATSSAHFWPSDGTDLKEVFEEIGRGIGNLRLTR